MQICRVEDIDVSGLVQGTVINFNRARSVTVQTSGIISATGLGILSLFCWSELRKLGYHVLLSTEFARCHKPDSIFLL
jgi:hypothetical protein